MNTSGSNLSFLLIFKTSFIIGVWMFHLHVCVYTLWVSSSEEGWKRMPEPLEPTVSCLVGVRGTELRSCKSNSRSRLLIILSGPVLILMRVTIFLLIFSTYIFFCQSTQQREVEIAVYLCVCVAGGGGAQHSEFSTIVIDMGWTCCWDFNNTL